MFSLSRLLHNLTMTKILTLLIVSILSVAACNKPKSIRADSTHQGRFLNGLGPCGPMVVIEVLQPTIKSVQDAQYVTQDSKSHDQGIAAEIPHQFQDGEQFYFTYDSLDYFGHYIAICAGVPKYKMKITKISKTPFPD